MIGFWTGKFPRLEIEETIEGNLYFNHGVKENHHTFSWFPQNIRAIMANVRLPKETRGMVMFWIKVKERTYEDLSSQADLTRENLTSNYPYFS